MVPEEKPQPEKAEVLRHLRHITRRWHELGEPVLLEIVHLSAEDKASVKNVAHFDPDDMGIDLAAEHVTGMNAHGVNSYVTVNPVSAKNRPKAGNRASAEHIVASFFHWADADSAEAASNIRSFVGPRCTFHVLTGSQPCLRPHVYWELEEPTRNLPAWSRVQRNIASTLGTDAAVVDPPRIMRLAGTINWPKPKKQAKGYIAEITRLKIYDDRDPVTSDQMDRAFTGKAGSTAPGFQIDTGDLPVLDRERARIQALSGSEWHNAVIRLVASYVAKGLSDDEIHSLTGPLTLAGFTIEDTAAEVQTAIDGARRKGWAPEAQYADPEKLALPESDVGIPISDFDTPRRPVEVEWFDDVAPALEDAYLVKGVLSAGAMSVVYGPSNSGKTFFALDIAFAVATGGPWRGRRASKAAVLYLAAEGGRGVANRIAALRQETGCCDVPLALKRAGLDLLHNQADLQHIADLAAAVQAKQPGHLLIVIDTLSRIMAGGDENSAADMTALIRNIDAVRAATGAHVMLVHHTGKDAARGARGHSSLRAATDTEIEVGGEDGGRLALVTKQRDYQGGESFGFALKSVTLGFDQDGDEVTSCVVEPADTNEIIASQRRTKGLGGNQKIIADTFDQMLAEGMGTPNPGGVGLPEPGRYLTVPVAELKRLSQGKMVAGNPRSAFSEAWKALTDARGLFCAASDLCWRLDRRIRH